MPLIDADMLLTLLIVACGSGLFLRLVAKEKHRREQHLELRLQEKIKELEEEECRRQVEEELQRKLAESNIGHLGGGEGEGEDESGD